MPILHMCVHVECPKCQGAGHLSDGQKCDDCHGHGTMNHLQPESGYYYSTDVLDHVDLAEYARLKNDEREQFRVISNASYVNLMAGSQSRLMMAGWFPVGTNTNTMLSELIGEPL